MQLFALKKLQKPPSKVAQKNLNPLFFPYCPELTTQTEEFMFQNVACRPTVYNTGILGFAIWFVRIFLLVLN